MFSLSSCRDSGTEDDAEKLKNKWFTSVISGSPATLDPQTCTGNTAAQVIGNVFRGLYCRTDGGSIIPAMAEECTVSDDGLVYTFKLSENVKWYGKNDFSAECTADDFVFAFERLFNPMLRSENAREYYCIKNAEAIHTGKVKDISMLGVKATGKYELTITLTEPRTDFTEMLSAPPSMPCNREFYERTEGQYGLVGDCVASNGYFYVNRWHYDKWVKDGNFIELKRNGLNAESLDTTARGVTLMINADGYESFLNGTTDLIYTTDPDQIQRLSGRYTSSTYTGGVWGVMFNTRRVFDNSDLRIALGGFVRNEFNDGIYSSAERIVPSDASIGSTLYREAVGDPTRASYSEAELLERGSRAMRGIDDGALSGMKLLIPEGTTLRLSIGSVLQQWQKNFGVYCMISELPYNDYIAAIESGDYDVAMVKLTGCDALSYLFCFSSVSAKNYAGVNSRKLDDILNSVLTSDNDSAAARYCLEAEQFVLDNCWFAPLCFETGYIFCANGVSGVWYDTSCGGMIFGSALKK